MRDQLRLITTGLFLAASAGVGACGGGHSSDAAATAGTPATTTTMTPTTNTAVAPTTGPTTTTAAPVEGHHSKLGGALVGAAVGHVLGGHAVAGAAAGALVQHERNKH